MAYATLVAPDLTVDLVEAGRVLLSTLDSDQVPVTGALWLYSDDDKGWRLIIVSPEVSRHGPKAFYQRLHPYFDSPPLDRIGLNLVTAVRPDDPLISLLRGAISTGPGISTIRFSRNVINGVLIPDALIYRIQ